MDVPVLLLCVLAFWRVEAAPDVLSSEDASFCSGELKVVYPGLDIDKCLIVPKNFRRNLSSVWKSPKIHFPRADERKAYVVVMADPDAPSRAEPTAAHWRHWLLGDVQGSELQRGQMGGTTLTDYSPPTPPLKSGLHRYQFLLYEQRPAEPPALGKREASSRGRWDLQAFVRRFHLGEPVAKLQLLTRNYGD